MPYDSYDNHRADARELNELLKLQREQLDELRKIRRSRRYKAWQDMTRGEKTAVAGGFVFVLIIMVAAYIGETGLLHQLMS